MHPAINSQQLVVAGRHVNCSIKRHQLAVFILWREAHGINRAPTLLYYVVAQIVEPGVVPMQRTDEARKVKPVGVAHHAKLRQGQQVSRMPPYATIHLIV